MRISAELAACDSRNGRRVKNSYDLGESIMSKNVLRNKAGTCAAYGGHIEPDKKKKVTFDLNVIDESEFNVVVGRGQRPSSEKNGECDGLEQLARVSACPCE